ncbi:MAG TPA: alpha/beta hydrolase [Miltoncostaeales bacterium]|nr:alpha/beta hydrolase [Miltoncostaeales bacterium]
MTTMTTLTTLTTLTPNHPAAARRDIWFESDGARLFALDIGHGHPVVFLHGGLADHRAALLRVAPLANTHRLLTPDLRGSGRSVHAGPLSWDRLADDLARLLGHLGVEHAVVGGTSMGSAVALRFALRHPQMLRGMILMSPLYPGADRPLAAAVTSAMRAMADAGEQALEHGVEALRPLFDSLPPPIRDVAIEMMLAFDAGSVAATTRFLARNEQPMESVRELEAIDVPVMVLPGIDPQHPAEIAALYAQHLRHPVVVAQNAPDTLEKVTQFCDDLDWNLST